MRFELGRAALRAGAADAAEHLGAAGATASEPAARVQALRELGLAHMATMRSPEAIDAFDRAAAIARPGDPERALAIEAEAIGVGQMDVMPVARVAEQLLSHPPSYAGITAGERAMLAVQAYETVRVNGRPAHAAELARRAFSAGFPSSSARARRPRSSARTR